MRILAFASALQIRTGLFSGARQDTAILMLINCWLLRYPEFWVVAALAILTGIALLVSWLAPNPNGDQPKFALFWSGLIISLIFGLTSSPLIAACATGIFSVAVAGVAIWSGKANLEKLARLPEWLLPFFAAFLIGIPWGIVVRANDLLSFRTRNLQFEFERMGFSKSQSSELMAQLVKSPDLIQKAVPNPPPAGRSNLISTEEIASFRQQVTGVQSNAPNNPVQQLELLRDGGDENLRRLIKDLEPLLSDEKVMDTLNSILKSID